MGEKKVDLVHIDEHYDCLGSYHESWLKAYPTEIKKLSLKEYMDYPWKDHGHNTPLFRFDNYLSLFMDYHKDQVDGVLLCTHLDGDKPRFEHKEIPIPNLLGFLNARINNISVPTIINLDLDYFTETGFEKPVEIFSRDYIQEIAEMIKKGLGNNSVLALTVALSPEFTGSWTLAEELATFVLKHIGYDFELSI